MPRSPRRHTPGLTLVELLIVIVVIVILIGILIPYLTECIDESDRMTCPANLKSIGNAIATYAAKYGGHYPTIYQYAPPPPGSSIPDCTGTQKWTDDPRGYVVGSITATTALPDWTGQAIPTGRSTSTQKGPFTCNLSCLYMLVRTGDAANPGIFRCPTDSNFKYEMIQDVENYWSFNFITSCSYSFQNQIYDASAATASGGRNTDQNTLDPKMVVLADMNPSRYYDPAHPPAELSKAALKAGVCTWNSPNHKYIGQNCLYGDTHVAWNDNPFCGFGHSNIWTRGSCTPSPTGSTDLSTAVWSNANPATLTTSAAGPPPLWTAPYGAAPISGPGAGTAHKFNSFLVP